MLTAFANAVSSPVAERNTEANKGVLKNEKFNRSENYVDYLKGRTAYEVFEGNA